MKIFKNFIKKIKCIQIKTASNTRKFVKIKILLFLKYLITTSLLKSVNRTP
jgi:hypothetical protein